MSESVIFHLAGAINERDDDDGAVGNRDAQFVTGFAADWEAGPIGGDGQSRGPRWRDDHEAPAKGSLMPEPRSATQDIRHRWFARVYPSIARAEEHKGGAEHRRELLARLTGRVVEIGAGHGVNFRYYPATVSEVVAVEPEPTLRSLAEQAARVTPVTVRVEAGTAESLPLEDGSCDAAVLSLVLCSLRDVDGALAEVRRVLRPTGELRFYEHVRSGADWVAGLQRAADVVWPHVAGGCHLHRDSVAAIERAGFEVTSLRRFRFMGLPQVLGAARVRPTPSP